MIIHFNQLLMITIGFVNKEIWLAIGCGPCFWVIYSDFIVIFKGIFIGFFLNLNFVSYFGRKSTIAFFVGLSGIAYILAGLSEN